MRILVFFLIITLKANFLLGQLNTVGLIKNSNEVTDGYVLFSPITNNSTYLIDNCGKLINSWTSDFKPGLVGYLTDSGHLIRSARTSIPLTLGGAGGRVEIFNWEGEVVWAENFVENGISHHDLALLPNGNILLLLWDPIPSNLAFQYGRDPETLDNEFLISEKLWEIKPIENNGYELIWEWKMIDHIVQNIDSTLPNFGQPENQPNKLDINKPAGSINQDWIHFNSISYNEERDEILLSARNLNEIYVIDHSTTTAEAQGNSGGISGKGGDLLYRWGNPQNYGQGNEQDQKLFGQHDAQWATVNNTSSVSIFNNGDGRPSGDFSTVDLLTLPIDQNGNYIRETLAAFGPENAATTYPQDPNENFFSARISGSQFLDNGNVLITNGSFGNLLEVSSEGEVAWEYHSPISIDGPVSQGSVAYANDIFKARRYYPEFIGFEAKDLTPGDRLELDWNEDGCMTTVLEYSSDNSLKLNILPNPFRDYIKLPDLDEEKSTWKIIDQHGRILKTGNGITSSGDVIDTYDLYPGIYLFMVLINERPAIFTEVILKQ